MVGFGMVAERRPRHYAMEVLRIRDKEERAAYLEKMVPDHFREWVKRYISMWWQDRERILREADNEKKPVHKSTPRRKRKSSVKTRYK